MKAGLQPRDLEILSHVARYRLTTQETLHRLFFTGATPEAPKTVVRRLREGGYLQSRPLYLRRAYYQLTRSAAALLGEPEEAARPLGPQALVRAYGVLAYCCHAESERQRLTRLEFHRAFPYLSENGIPFDAFYVERDPRLRLMQIVVDQGGDARRLLRKCRTRLKLARETPGLSDLVRGGEFGLALVTSSNEKAEALRAGRQQSEFLRDYPFRFQAEPELIHLIPNRALGGA